MSALLEVEQLTVRAGERALVRDVSLRVERGEIVGLVGESGSGKTVTSLAIARLLGPGLAVEARALRLGDIDLTASGAATERMLATRMGVVFQDPMSSLNPALRIGTQLTEAVRVHRGMAAGDALTLASRRLEDVHVGASATRLRQHPHELSGGMRQRVMIAMGAMIEPELLIADEPTTALDVTVQAQVMALLRELNREHGTAVLIVSHNIALLAGLCQRILVMYAGRMVEELPAGGLGAARHPYTEALLAAVPDLDAPRDQPLRTIAGAPPTSEVAGCPFAARCPLAVQRCREQHPPLTDAGDGRRVACWVRGEAAS
jgi:peptide/nickel transport system permease protein